MKIIFLALLILIGLNISCSNKSKDPGKKIDQFTRHDKVLFAIGECSRSRRDNVVKACLKKYKTHVFQGKILRIDFAYAGVEAIVDIGQTEVTCHAHPTNQNYEILKSLLVGDTVVVNGLPEEFHNAYSYNNLILKDCTLLPVK